MFSPHKCGDYEYALFPTGRIGIYKIKTGAWRESGMQVTFGPMGRETIHFEAPTYTNGTYKYNKNWKAIYNR